MRETHEGSLQDPGYQYPASYQPQTTEDAELNALPDTSSQFDAAALKGYGVLETKKREKKAYVETKEFAADLYEQATDALEDEELAAGVVAEDVQNFLTEQEAERRERGQGEEALQAAALEKDEEAEQEEQEAKEEQEMEQEEQEAKQEEQEAKQEEQEVEQEEQEVKQDKQEVEQEEQEEQEAMQEEPEMLPEKGQEAMS